MQHRPLIVCTPLSFWSQLLYILFRTFPIFYQLTWLHLKQILFISSSLHFIQRICVCSIQAQSIEVIFFQIHWKRFTMFAIGNAYVSDGCLALLGHSSFSSLIISTSISLCQYQWYIFLCFLGFFEYVYLILFFFLVRQRLSYQHKFIRLFCSRAMLY